MKKNLLTASLVLSSMMMSAAVSAEGSIQNYGQSTSHISESAQHSAGAMANGIVGTTKLVSGAVAVPFKGLGMAGDASEKVGDFLWDQAMGEKPLEVSDDTLTAGPSPLVALNN